MTRTPMGTATCSRTFGLVGHTSAGKTQLAEILLHAAGVVRQPGAVDRGDVLLDFEPEERARRGSTRPAWAWAPWGDAVLHLVDTPGAEPSSHLTRLALAGVDAEVLVVSAPEGVECGAEDALRRVRREGRPLLAVINKIDRGGDLPAIAARIEALSGRRPAVLQVPLRDEDGSLAGVVDVLAVEALRYAQDGSGALSREPVPSRLLPGVLAARESLLEAIAMTDDALLEAYLEHLDLPAEHALDGLRQAVGRAELVPVVLASATRHIGAQPLLDAVVHLLPGPTPIQLQPDGPAPGVVAQWVGTRLDDDGRRVTLLGVRHGAAVENAVWRNARTGESARVRRLYQVRGARRARARHVTAGAILATWDALPGRPGDTFTDGPPVHLPTPSPRPPMAWLLVEPRGHHRRAELDAALAVMRLVEPSVTWTEDPLTEGVRLAGASQAQLDAFVLQLRTRFGLHLDTCLPPVAYLERPVAPVRDARGVHRRTLNGEVASLGEVWLDLHPLDADERRFVGDVDEDVLPERFVRPISEGAFRALRHGPMAGYPVAGVFVRCTGGDYDVLASQEDHFETAAEQAVRAALERAGTELLEPWSEVEVFAPSAEVGAVLSDLASHRGRVVGMEVSGEETSIRVHCPERELQTFARRLEALTRGRGWFVARRSHYDRLPRNLVGEAVASSPFRRARPTAEAR